MTTSSNHRHCPTVTAISVLVMSFWVWTSTANAAESKASDLTTKVSTGLFYASGQSETIDTDDSTTTSIPLMISMKKGRFSFGLSTAYLSVETDTLEADGMGDTIASVGYDLMESPWLSIKLKEKFATGDETQGLSTGKNDTSLQLDWFYPLQSNTSLFANIGHKFVGKVSGSAMQDTNYASAGMGYIFTNKTNIGLSLDYRQSIFKDLDDQTGVSLFVSKPLNKTYSLSAFGGYDSSATTTAGLTLTTKF